MLRWFKTTLLVDGWTNPIEKYANSSNWIMKPQGSGMKIPKNFKKTPPATFDKITDRDPSGDLNESIGETSLQLHWSIFNRGSSWRRYQNPPRGNDDGFSH